MLKVEIVENIVIFIVASMPQQKLCATNLLALKLTLSSYKIILVWRTRFSCLLFNVSDSSCTLASFQTVSRKFKSHIHRLSPLTSLLIFDSVLRWSTDFFQVITDIRTLIFSSDRNLRFLLLQTIHKSAEESILVPCLLREVLVMSRHKTLSWRH